MKLCMTEWVSHSMIFVTKYSSMFFRKQGLTYVNPDVPNWDQKLIPIHVAMREKCRLLLYVISNDRRSLASMCEVSTLECVSYGFESFEFLQV